MRKLMPLALVTMLVAFCSMAYAIDPKDEAGNQKQVLAVKNPEGESLGTIKDIFVNYLGTAAFAIISVGEKGEREIAVPLGAFLYDRENEVFILNISKENIAAGPEFSIKGVYEFFGVAPPWTDETPQDGEGK